MTPESRREQLYSLLGDLPPRDHPISATQISARPILAAEDEGYVLETWMLDLNGIEPVPAYFTRPLSLAGLDRIDRELRRVYADAGAPDAWKLLRWDIGHFETHAIRAEIVAFL